MFPWKKDHCRQCRNEWYLLSAFYQWYLSPPPRPLPAIDRAVFCPFCRRVSPRPRATSGVDRWTGQNQVNMHIDSWSLPTCEKGSFVCWLDSRNPDTWSRAESSALTRHLISSPRGRQRSLLDCHGHWSNRQNGRQVTIVGKWWHKRDQNWNDALFMAPNGPKVGDKPERPQIIHWISSDCQQRCQGANK